MSVPILTDSKASGQIRAACLAIDGKKKTTLEKGQKTMIKNILIGALAVLLVAQYVQETQIIKQQSDQIAEAIQQVSDDLLEACERKIDEITNQ